MAEGKLSASSSASPSPLSFCSAVERLPTLQDFDDQSSLSEPSTVPSTDIYSAPAFIPNVYTQGAQPEVPQQLQDFLNHYRNMSQSFSVSGRSQSTVDAGGQSMQTPTRHERSSVKHLTCFWWKTKGVCRFSDEECLYAHHDTGHYTDPPRQIIPGEPALAGRKLDRAMRNLAGEPRSSVSLSSMVNSRHNSRPSTPGLDYSPSISSPIPNFQTHADLGRLSNDNQFLRNLVEQNAKEKAVMISHIEDLQAENKAMKAEVEGLRKAQEQLLAEREGLQNRIHELEIQGGGGRGFNAPYGVIGVYGRGRMNSETRYLGHLLDE